jgi:hypothetical protein
MKNVSKDGLNLMMLKIGGIKMNDKQFETLLAIEEDQAITLERIAKALEVIAKCMQLG